MPVHASDSCITGEVSLFSGNPPAVLASPFTFAVVDSANLFFSPKRGGSPLADSYPTWNDYADYATPLGGYVPNNGDCFKFQLWEVHAHGTGGSVTYDKAYGLGCTGCFKRQDASCYGSVIEYSCNENSFGFVYPSGKFNRVELPVYLERPIIKVDQKVYKKSDNSNTLLYSRMDEVYEGRMDWTSYLWNKNLHVALQHDTVRITNDALSSYDPINTAALFVLNGDYEYIYPPAPITMVQVEGKFKLMNAQPVSASNNNCG